MDFFDSYWCSIPRRGGLQGTNIKDSFGLSLNIEVLDKWTIRTPLFAAESITRYCKNFKDSQLIVLNLRNEFQNFSGITSKALLTFLGRNPYEAGVLRTVSTSKQVVYRGCLGFIMNEDYSPIYVQMVDLHNTHGYWTIDNPTVRIAPSVFANSSGVIEKSIIKQIPIDIEEGVNIRELRSNNYNHFKCGIVIENLDYMINVTNIPKISYCKDDSLNRSIIE